MVSLLHKVGRLRKIASRTTGITALTTLLPNLFRGVGLCLEHFANNTSSTSNKIMILTTDSVHAYERSRKASLNYMSISPFQLRAGKEIDTASITQTPSLTVQPPLLVFTTSFIILESQTGRDRALPRASVQIMPHFNSRQVRFRNSELALPPWCPSYVLQLEYFSKRSC